MEDQDGQRPSKRVRLSMPTEDTPVEVSGMSEPPSVSRPPISLADDHQVMTEVPETNLPGLGTVDSQAEVVHENTTLEAEAQPVVLSAASNVAVQSEPIPIDEPTASENMAPDNHQSNELDVTHESEPIKPIKVEDDEVDQLSAQGAPATEAPETGAVSTKLEDAEDGSAMDTGESASSADVPAQEGSIKSEDVEEEREFETDSSPYESSDEDDSSDVSTSDEDDDDDEFKLLTPAEAARILMQDEVGSDDEGKLKQATNAKVKTMHEEVDEPIEMPDLEITEDMEISILGSVENIVEGMVLIKAKATGEYQVLEPSSVLCTSDRKLLGVIAETMGQVQQPYYVLRFKDEEGITEAGITIGQEIYYVPSHSKFVFTKALQALKGSDASNFYDEEVAADEIEFSDDEAEAEYKRRRKMRTAANADNAARARNKRRGGSSHQPSGLREYASYAGDTEMNYGDDVKSGDTSYTPLSRPSNLTEMTHGYVAPTEGSHAKRQGPSHPHPRTDFTSDRGRGQGQRGRGPHRGGRAGRPHSDDRSRREHQSSHRSHQAYPSNPPQFARPDMQPPLDPSAPSYLPPAPKLPDSAMHPPPQNLNPYSIPPRPQMMMPQFYNAVPPNQPLAQPTPFRAESAILHGSPDQSYSQPQGQPGYIHPQTMPGYQGMPQQQQGYGMGMYAPQGQPQPQPQTGYGYQQQYAQQNYQAYAGQAQEPYYGYQSMQNQNQHQNQGGYGAPNGGR